MIIFFALDFGVFGSEFGLQNESVPGLRRFAVRHEDWASADFEGTEFRLKSG